MADPSNFANVKLLLHFDGANASTTFADSSNAARTVTAGSNAALSTAQSKFGGASCYFDGSGDYLSVPTSTDFDFGTGDWTIEFWYRPAAVGTQRILLGKSVATGYYPFQLILTAAGYMIGRCGAPDFTGATPEAGTVLTTGNWYHVAFVRASNALRVYVNGAATGAAVAMTTAHFVNTAPLCIGNYSVDYANGAGSAVGAYGHMDELRVVKGEALYTTDFTPPTAAFPDGPPKASIAAGTMLGAPALLSARRPQAALSTPGPLADPSLLARLRPWAMLSADGPLSAAGLLASVRPGAVVSVGAVLGQPEVLAHVPAFGWAEAPGPLASPALRAVHDFSRVVDAAASVEYWVCDLEIYGMPVARVPISSWQGTLQLNASCYLQAVVPAVADYAEMINGLAGAGEFVIRRGARMLDGQAIEYEMARSVIEVVQFDRGPYRYTCTMSGYSAAIPEPDGVTPAARVMRGVRSISSGSGGTRTRCAIDWLLRPGMPAIAEDVALSASYINYYVVEGDAYMDVGERA